MIFLVLVVVQIALAKPRKTCKKTVEYANSTFFKHLNYCTCIQHLFDIASLRWSLFMSLPPIQNSDKFDIRIARISLVQDNTEIFDWDKYLNNL